MKISLFQIVILGTFAALAVAGVAIFAFVVSSPEYESIGDVEVWGTLDAAAFANVLRLLGEEDSRMKTVTYIKKNPETYARELTEALASGTGPELFVVTQHDTVRDGRKVVPIPYESFSLEQFQNTFVEAANPFLVPEGVLAVPFAVDPLVLFWNRDMLSSSGLAKAPVYWDELYDMATKITKRDQTNSIQKSALSFGEYANVTHAKDIISLLILQAGGQITMRDNAGQLVPALVSRNDGQQATESALRFYTEFANPVKAFYTWNRAQPESRTAFGSGDLAFYVGFASEEPLIRRINPNLNFAVAAVPQIRTRDYAVNVGTVYGFAVPRAGENYQGAITIAYLLASSKASGLLSQALGMPSARRDVLSTTVSCYECLQSSASCVSTEQRMQCSATFEASPITGTDHLFNKQAIIARSWVDPEPDKTDAIFQAMIESITSGAVRLQEAIQRAETAIGELTNT